MIGAAWREHRLRTALTLIGVTVCVIALTTLDGMLGHMHAERAQDAARFANRILLQPPGAGYPPFRALMREATVGSALERSDIVAEQSTPLVLLILAPADNPMDIAQVAGLGIIPGREAAWLGPAQAASGGLTLEGQGQDAVILGSVAARYYGAATAGQEVVFSGHAWHVVGILKPTGSVRLDDLAVMPLRSAQTVFDLDNRISAVLLTAREGAANELAASLTSEHPRLEVYTQDRIRASLQKELELPNSFLGTLSWIAFVIAVLIIANITSIAVAERARNLERIRAFGGARIAILGSTMGETVSLSLLGGIIGAAVAVPVAFVFGWTWILAWREIARVEGLALCAGVLAGIYPALRVARAYPKALPYEKLRREMQQTLEDKRALDLAYRHQIKGREEERARLARELHDQAIQGLVGLKFSLAGGSPGDSQKMVNGIIEMLRNTCSDLRPPSLEGLGLVAALQSLIGEFRERSDLPVEFQVEGEARQLAPDTELCLFRVCQEGLSNSWRHSQAPKVEVIVRFSPGGTLLTVADRGRGFTVPDSLQGLVDAGHFGLVGMRERMQSVGGTLQIYSKQNEGTRVTAWVPAGPGAA